MKTSRILAFILALLLPMAGFASGFAAVTSAPADTPVRTGFTLIPGSLASERSPVEMRTGLANDGKGTLELEVRFHLDGKRLGSQSVRLAPGAWQVVRHTWNPVGKAGRHLLSTEILVGDRVLDRHHRVLQVAASETTGLPIGNVAWIEPLAYVDGTYRADRSIRQSDVIDDMREMKELGIDTVIYAYPEFMLYGMGALYESDLDVYKSLLFPQPLKYDLLGTVMAEAEKNGQHVLVGTGRGMDLFIPVGAHDPDGTRFEPAVDLAVEVMTDIWERYGHYASFYGWYMSHEPSYLFDSANGDLYFFNAIVRQLRHLWPDKVVLIAPTGTPTIDPAAIARSEPDIYAYQDAVGPGYIPGRYTYDPENRIAMLDDVFGQYQQKMASTGKHLWSDFETWQMDGPNYDNAYPAAWSRVSRQLEILQKYVSIQSMYAYPGYLDSPESTLRHGGDAAVDLYEAYAAVAKAFLSDKGIVSPSLKSVRSPSKVTAPSAAAIGQHLPGQLSGTLDDGTPVMVPVRWEEPVRSGSAYIVQGTAALPGVEGVHACSATVAIEGATPTASPSDGPTQGEPTTPPATPTDGGEPTPAEEPTPTALPTASPTPDGATDTSPDPSEPPSVTEAAPTPLERGEAIWYLPIGLAALAGLALLGIAFVRYRRGQSSPADRIGKDG